MNKGIFAICDWESDYLYHFMRFAESQFTNLFQIHGFSNTQSLMKYAADNQIELLLISNKMVEQWIFDINCKIIVLLSEGEIRLGYEQYDTVYKYQSAQEMIGQILYYYAVREEEAENRDYKLFKDSTNLIGFYSPWNDDMQTSLAITFGCLESEERNTLYLNLKGFHGFSEYMNRSFQRDLSDLIYYFRNKPDKLEDYVYSVISKIKSLDYIPPVENPMDIKEVAIKEWVNFLDKLIQVTRYETIILDLNDEVMNSLDLLEKCSKIYVPVRKEKSSHGKFQQLEEMLIIKEKQIVQDKMIKVIIAQETLDETAEFLQKEKKEEEENKLIPDSKE